MTAISIYFSQNVACIFVSILELLYNLLLLRDEIIITATNQSYVLFFLNKKINELLMTLNISLHKDLEKHKTKINLKKKTQVEECIINRFLSVIYILCYIIKYLFLVTFFLLF